MGIAGALSSELSSEFEGELLSDLSEFLDVDTGSREDDCGNNLHEIRRTGFGVDNRHGLQAQFVQHVLEDS